MNTEISEIEEENKELPSGESTPPAEPPEPPEKPDKPRSGGGLAFFAVLLSFTALLGTAWMWWQDQSSQGNSESLILTEIARLESADQEAALKLRAVRDQLDTLPTPDHTADLAALESRLKPRIADLDRLEQTASEQLALTRNLQAAAESMQARLLAAEAAVSGLAGQELDAGGELDLAEVDYLLRLANERLKLFADPVAADEVLELADMHLEAMNNPIYLGVRQEIAAARQELSGLMVPDYIEISNELDAIQTALGGLPFRDEVASRTEPETAPQPEEEGWWAKLKGAFSGLVTVRRSTDQENERISLEDKDYVRQRIWIQLEIAHLALMRRDQQSFRHVLGRVQQTISSWFDVKDSKVQALVQKVQAMQKLDVQVDVPDITQPWATLRLIRAGQARQIPVAPVTSAPPAAESEPVTPVTSVPPAAESEPVTTPGVEAGSDSTEEQPDSEGSPPAMADEQPSEQPSGEDQQ